MWEERFFISRKNKARYKNDSESLDGTTVLSGCLYMVEAANVDTKMYNYEDLFDCVMYCQFVDMRSDIDTSLISHLVFIDRMRFSACLTLQTCF